MKISTSFLFGVCAVATFAGSARATVYVDNFQSGWVVGDMTTGSNALKGWTVNDPTPDVGSIMASLAPFGNKAATLGYTSPVSADPIYLSHSASTPLIGGGVDATFSVLFTIQDSNSGFNSPFDPGPPPSPAITGSENRDSFGFRLENSSGDNLFSFLMKPTVQSATPEEITPIEYNALYWSTGVGAPTLVLPSWKVAEFSNYTFTVNFFDAGDGVAGFTAGLGGDTFGGTLGAGSASEVIGRFGAVWDLYATAAEPGSNLIQFDGVNLVPEPSSALLGLLGTSFLFVRRRRA